LDLAKRLTEKQKQEITQAFKDGKSVDYLYQEFNCSKLTIIRNLKLNLGEEDFKKLVKKNKNSINKNILSQSKGKKNENEKINDKELNLKESEELLSEEKNSNDIRDVEDFYPDASFLEISPLDYEIDNASRKELSSIPISQIDFPQIVYMIVDKKIELEIKLLKDYPEWNFLPIDDLNRKTIEIFFDLKTAKRVCRKEQKVIKVPNTNVFEIAAPILISKGISRIISDDKLIAL